MVKEGLHSYGVMVREGLHCFMEAQYERRGRTESKGKRWITLFGFTVREGLQCFMESW